MKTRMIKIVLLGLLLVSCQEEEIVPTPQPALCDCYEQHERLSSNLGVFTWVFDYNTNPIPELCEKDNGVWIYTDQSTYRYKYICQ